ncbi:hypothetical protein TSACC_21998 [Terrimicrobium sacchariphilum]|uniref:DUF3828 domain-containing protein n=1 Tax=Terrimicrobium sacchariphilum TaxID=690879 RepID=A0A146G7W3_TERSA|nr:DUF3828 domain-containing protein [Terrimicrobium sacchariphilum]GAT33581.1 hypothetical protein TSACC_21998 [Terrimicrobium sacchariphilum]
MSRILALLLLVLPVSVSLANDEADIRTAVQGFYDSYIQALPKLNGYKGTMNFVAKDPRVTPEFATALRKVYTKALKDDPELGYGSDAIVCGQDWPDKGFQVGKIKIDRDGDEADVKVVSREPNFKHTIDVEVVKRNGRWLINEIGDISGD